MLHLKKKGFLLFFMFQKSMNGNIKVVSTSNDSSDSSSNRNHHLTMKKRRSGLNWNAINYLFKRSEEMISKKFFYNSNKKRN